MCVCVCAWVRERAHARPLWARLQGWLGGRQGGSGRSALLSAQGALGAELLSVLRQWQTPRNGLGLLDTALNVSRLDCHYTFCPWPDQDARFTLTALPVPPATAARCDAPLGNASGGFGFVQLPPESRCTPEQVAAAAIKAGAQGVVLAAAPGDAPRPIGNSAAADREFPEGLSRAVAMVSAADGARVASALGNGGPARARFYTEGARGQFAAVDAQGRVAEVGWAKYSTLLMPLWEAQWLAYQKELQARLAAPALVVPVFDGALPGTAHTVTMPPKVCCPRAPVPLPVCRPVCRVAQLCMR